MIENKNSLDKIFIDITRSYVRNEKYLTPLSKEQLQSLYEIGKMQKMTSLMYHVLKEHPLIESIPDFRTDCLYEISFAARQQIVRSTIKNLFELRDIESLFLKGECIQELYHNPYDRWTTDIDILIRESDQKNVRDILASYDIHTYLYNHVTQDSYVTRDGLLIEIHRELVPRRLQKQSVFFQENINQYFDVKTQRDMHIFFIICHHLRHIYLGSGVGMRLYLDMYLLINKYYETIHSDAFNRMFEKTGMQHHFLQLEQTLTYLFEDSLPDNVSMSKYVNFYIFGDDVSNFNRKLSNIGGSKAKYFIRRIFPRISDIIDGFPILGRAPVLLPLIWIYRLVVRVPIKFKLLYKEFVYLLKAQK